MRKAVGHGVEILSCLLRDDDLRSPRAHDAFGQLIRRALPDGHIIAVGGGPLRLSERFINLNIEPFTNVDIIGTAFRLPLKSSSVAGVHCEAVLEHLEFPDRAVEEMFRVLKPGAIIFSSTPFLQVYHAYPDHYQNFTLTGHVRMFERHGFRILDSGVCVGPTFALVDVAANYFRESLPGWLLSRIAGTRHPGRRSPDSPTRHCASVAPALVRRMLHDLPARRKAAIVSRLFV